MRSALKTLSYSATHLVVAMAVAYALTRDWRVALGIGLIEPMVQTIAYAVHERVWERLGLRGAARAACQPPLCDTEAPGAPAAR